MFDTPLLEKAVSVYMRSCERAGDEASQPSESFTRREGNTIVVANTTDVLARYRVLPGDRLVQVV